MLIAGARLFRVFRYRFASPQKQFAYDVELIKKKIVLLSKRNICDRGFLSDYASVAPGDVKDDLDKVFRISYRLEYSKGEQTVPTPEENALARSLREKLQKR